MKRCFLLKTKNYRTTFYYYEIIAEVFKQLGYQVTISQNIKDCFHGKSDVYIVGYIVDYIKLFLLGKRNVIIWMQGIRPEESYMHDHSSLKRMIFSFLEWFTLKNAKFLICVSNEMINHYKRKYKIDISKRSYIMPCFNTQINKNSFYCEGKYSNNIFSYVGGLAVWQCFNETLSLYKQIEKESNNTTRLKVLTPDVDIAVDLIRKHQIVNYTVKYVKPEELYKELNDVKFGFILRTNSPVNNVATPTKLSTYLANGIIPILSENITDYYNLFKENQYFAFVNNQHKINDLMNMNIDGTKVFTEYNTIFNSYFSKEQHIESMKKSLQNLPDV